MTDEVAAEKMLLMVRMDPGGLCGVDAKDFEDDGEEPWVKRRNPGGWAGMAGEGVRVSVASGKCAGDAAHLPAELEVVLAETNSIGVGEGDVEHAHEKTHPEHGRRCFEERGCCGQRLGLLHSLSCGWMEGAVCGVRQWVSCYFHYAGSVWNAAVLA